MERGFLYLCNIETIWVLVFLLNGKLCDYRNDHLVGRCALCDWQSLVLDSRMEFGSHYTYIVTLVFKKYRLENPN